MRSSTKLGEEDCYVRKRPVYIIRTGRALNFLQRHISKYITEWNSSSSELSLSFLFFSACFIYGYNAWLSGPPFNMCHSDPNDKRHVNIYTFLYRTSRDMPKGQKELLYSDSSPLPPKSPKTTLHRDGASRNCNGRSFLSSLGTWWTPVGNPCRQ